MEGRGGGHIWLETTVAARCQLRTTWRLGDTAGGAPSGPVGLQVRVVWPRQDSGRLAPAGQPASRPGRTAGVTRAGWAGGLDGWTALGPPSTGVLQDSGCSGEMVWMGSSTGAVKSQPTTGTKDKFSRVIFRRQLTFLRGQTVQGRHFRHNAETVRRFAGGGGGVK